MLHMDEGGSIVSVEYGQPGGGCRTRSDGPVQLPTRLVLRSSVAAKFAKDAPRLAIGPVRVTPEYVDDPAMGVEGVGLPRVQPIIQHPPGSDHTAPRSLQTRRGWPRRTQRAKRASCRSTGTTRGGLRSFTAGRCFLTAAAEWIPGRRPPVL